MADYISFQPSDYYNTKLYTGTGSSNAITGVGFQPDWVWIKVRSEANDHEAYDAVRTATERLIPDTSAAEDTNTAGLTAFGADGFTVNTGHAVNKSTATYVAWNWKAGTTTGIAGSPTITPTSYSFNATSGFSIIAYTGTGVAATLPHGLGVVPKMIWVKKRSGTGAWTVYNNSIGNTKYLQLDGSSAPQTGSTIWNDTTPTSSVFSVGTDGDVNGSSATYIAYVFVDIKGYSKVGSYLGNGNIDGTFVYTGFRPAFILTKKTSGTGYWTIWDNKRDPYNWCGQKLYPNTDDAEQTEATGNCDFVSNGIKWRNTGASNNSGATFLYMAFAEFPIVSSNYIPGTAR